MQDEPNQCKIHTVLPEFCKKLQSRPRSGSSSQGAGEACCLGASDPDDVVPQAEHPPLHQILAAQMVAVATKQAHLPGLSGGTGECQRANICSLSNAGKYFGNLSKGNQEAINCGAGPAPSLGWAGALLRIKTAIFRKQLGLQVTFSDLCSPVHFVDCKEAQALNAQQSDVCLARNRTA